MQLIIGAEYSVNLHFITASFAPSVGAVFSHTVLLKMYSIDIVSHFQPVGNS